MDTAVTCAILPAADGVSLEAVASAISELQPRHEGQQLRISNHFVVRVAETRLPSRLDWTFSSKTAPIGARCIEVVRPAEGWLGRGASPELMAQVGITGLSPSVTSDRFLELTSIVCRLAPLATAVVQPLANYMAVPASEFVAEASHFFATRNPGPLWSYPLHRASDAGAWIETAGLSSFGLPELAMPMELAQRDAFDSTAHALMRATISNGPLPTGAVVNTPVGELRLERDLFGAHWFQPTASTMDGGRITRARSCVARKRALGTLLGAHSHLHVPRTSNTVAQEHFSLLTGGGIAITNGVSDAAQPGADPRQHNAHVELVVRSARLGPWTRDVLAWAARSLHGHDGARPFRAFDRLVPAAPMQDIAAAMLWPFGHLQPDAATRVELWLLLPLASAELAQFRERPDVQTRWMQERESRRDIEVIEQRWAQLDAVRH